MERHGDSSADVAAEGAAPGRACDRERADARARWHGGPNGGTGDPGSPGSRRHRGRTDARRRRPADRAGAIRKALATAGLDPDGRDQLVLLRFPEERKQTRRDDFAKANCVLAMAGDERADFDELFSYLRDPAAATTLDVLIGKRWFLVPPPLN